MLSHAAAGFWISGLVLTDCHGDNSHRGQSFGRCEKWRWGETGNCRKAQLGNSLFPCLYLLNICKTQYVYIYIHMCFGSRFDSSHGVDSYRFHGVSLHCCNLRSLSLFSFQITINFKKQRKRVRDRCTVHTRTHMTAEKMVYQATGLVCVCATNLL